MGLKYKTDNKGNVRWQVRGAGDTFLAGGKPRGFPNEELAYAAVLETGETLIAECPELTADLISRIDVLKATISNREATCMERFDRIQVLEGANKFLTAGIAEARRQADTAANTMQDKLSSCVENSNALVDALKAARRRAVWVPAVTFLVGLTWGWLIL